MPELPEVETMCRGIASTVGSQIVAAQRPACSRRPILFTPEIKVFSRRVVGRRIAKIGRRGKRVLIHLNDGQTLVIEPRMTGLVLLAEPPTTDHLRLRLTLAGDAESGAVEQELLFWDRRGLGTVRLLNEHEAAEVLGFDRIGPDALQITLQELRTGLARSARPIKVALLDQKRIAGVGNLYAAEILHLAGVDPRVRCDALSGPQWRRIHAAISAVLLEAIEHEGSTLSDGTYRNALNQDGGYQNLHRVYDRAGRTCGRCDRGVIQRIVQAQRSTFYCPVCQTRRGRHRAVPPDA